MPGSAGRSGGVGRPLAALAVALFAALLVLAVAGSASAGASVIVYRCAPNLCEVNPDGSGQHALTSDGGGAAGVYGSPSLSRDGSSLAFDLGNQGYVMNLATGARTALDAGSVEEMAMRPDGGQVGLITQQFLAYPFNSLENVLSTVNPDGSGFANHSYEPFSVGWLGSTLLRDGPSATAHPGTAAIAICQVPAAGVCGANVADDPVRDLYEPAGSPDGSLVAVTALPYPVTTTQHPVAGTGAIAIYDAAGGAWVRDLTAGPGDSQPAWSPDGTQIAFARGGSIYTIAAAGPPGSERLLVAGDSPTWGEGSAGGSPVPSPAPAPGAAPASPGLRLGKPKLNRRRGTATLAVTVPGPGRVALSGRGVVAVKKSARRAGSVTLPVRPARKARRRLLRAGRVAVEVAIAFTPVAGPTLHATRTLRLALGPAGRR